MNVVPRIFVGARRKGRFAPFARKSRRVPRIFWPIRQDLSLPPVRRFALPYGRSIIAEQYRFWFSSTTTPTQSFRKAPPRSLSVKPILGGGPRRRRRRQAAPRTKATHRNVSFGDRCVAGAGDRSRMSIIFQGAFRISRVYIHESIRPTNVRDMDYM